MNNFGLIGASGYIAPRHLNAIKNNNGNLVIATDVSDSVGILDSYFNKCLFYTDFASFDNYVKKIKDTDDKIDFMSICSPNYLHYEHKIFMAEWV